MQKEVYYAERTGVILWNAADALKDTSYAKAVDGSGITDGAEVRFQWQQAEEGKSIRLLPAEGENTGNVTWEENTACAPYLEYKVRIEQAGGYYFSFYANSPDVASDSFHILVNGSYCYTTNTNEVISNGSDANGSSVGERWYMCNLKKVILKKGENTIRIAACESGVLLWQLRLSRQNPIFIYNQWQETTGLANGTIDLEIESGVGSSRIFRIYG